MNEKEPAKKEEHGKINLAGADLGDDYDLTVQ
jgi:hypothetical protein